MRFFPLLLLALLASGCDSAQAPAVGQPRLTFSTTTLDADFFQVGTSPLPSLDWNGEQGVVSLGTSLAGLSVDSSTGQLSWTRRLPPGTHVVEVAARNSAGQVVVPVTIANPLEGNFVGVSDGSVYFAHRIRPDGTVTVEANSQDSPNVATGTWQAVGDAFVFEFTYSGDRYFTVLDLAQTESQATLVGGYGFGAYDPTTPLAGSVSLSLN